MIEINKFGDLSEDQKIQLAQKVKPPSPGFHHTSLRLRLDDDVMLSLSYEELEKFEKWRLQNREKIEVLMKPATDKASCKVYSFPQGGGRVKKSPLG